jgi:hypothetical protein
MLRLRGRLNKLEQVLVPAKGPRRHTRVVIGAVYGTPNLATSTCIRRLSQGALTELVNLDGSRDEWSDEQLERFIESFPIQEGAECCA